MSAATSPPLTSPNRTLVAACAAHVVHDGYTDLLYIFLPVWQIQFGLAYSSIALLRGIYLGFLSLFQIPSGLLNNWLSYRAVLFIGTLITAVGFGLAGCSTDLSNLAAALALAGIGSSVQHPQASGAISRVFRADPRGPLGIYNFAGDLGKSALPLAASLLLSMFDWRTTLLLLAAFGVSGALLIRCLMPRLEVSPPSPSVTSSADFKYDTRFVLLSTIGVLDTVNRLVVLLFIPFLLSGKGADAELLGIALSMVFIGGAGGKVLSTQIGRKIGICATVVITELATAVAVPIFVLLPLRPSLVVLPILGALLNGTSSVLYGMVAMLARGKNVERTFATFYTATLGSGAVMPVLFGLLGDATNPSWGAIASSSLAVIIVPLIVQLSQCWPDIRMN